MSFNEKYRLRTKQFAVSIIKYYGTLPYKDELRIMGKQLLRSATSVAANLVNYYQTGYDSSIKGFRNRLSVSLILNAKLTDKLSLTNSFDMAYEDKPLIPITKLIYTLKIGISIDL